MDYKWGPDLRLRINWDFFLIGTWAFRKEQDQLRKETNRFCSAFIRSLVTHKSATLVFRQRTYKHIHTRQPIHHRTHTNKYNTCTHTDKHSTYTSMILQTHTHTHVQKAPCIHFAHIYIYHPLHTTDGCTLTHTQHPTRKFVYMCVCECVYLFKYMSVQASPHMYVFRGTKDMETMAGNKQTVCMTRSYQRTECCCWRYACPPDYRDYFIISFERLVRKAWSSALDTCLACKSSPRHTVGA